GIRSTIPAPGLTLNLTRATIRLERSRPWRIGTTPPAEGRVGCRDGRGERLSGRGRRRMEAGEAMRSDRWQRFQVWNEGPASYTGIAQHFTLDIYGRHDLIAQMDLRPKVHLSRWALLEPLVRQYRQTAPPSSITLSQHHLFMYLLIAFIEDAFI